MLEGEEVPKNFRLQAAQLKRCMVLSSLELTRLEKKTQEQVPLRLSRLVCMNQDLQVPYLSLA